MFKKNINIFKNVIVVLLLFFGIAACEKDIEDIGVDLVDNGIFKVGDSSVEIVAYNINVNASRVDNNGEKIPGYLMGVNDDTNFGYLNSTLISQLHLPGFGADFGDNPVFDLAVLDIPYFTTKDDENIVLIDPVSKDTLIVPSFQLDSIYGKTDLEFQVKISELETFLNTLDPEDPTKNKEYYSDRDYQISNQIYYGGFTPNRNDTVLYVERRHLDDDPSVINDIDTIKTFTVINNDSVAVPTMKFILDDNYIQTHFIDQNGSSYFDSNDNFIRYFKGMYIESIGTDGSLINIPASNGKMTIYYTNEETKDEAEGEDLNGNGITEEEGVLVKVKQKMIFPMIGVKSAKYERNYAGKPIENAILNPNTVDGEKRLYVQNVAGSEAIIKLFTKESLRKLRLKGWLINEANLVINIDRTVSSDDVPKKLFLYKYESSSVMDDYLFKGPEVFGGSLEYAKDSTPKSYKFKITKYISDVLADDGDQIEPVDLALKAFMPTDVSTINPNDTIVSNYGWVPRGVVLYGNLPKEEEKRIKLEIFYSK